MLNLFLVPIVSFILFNAQCAQGTSSIDLSPQALNSSAIQLDWNPPDDMIYTLQVFDNETKLISQGEFENTTATVTGLFACQVYTVQVMAMFDTADPGSVTSKNVSITMPPPKDIDPVSSVSLNCESPTNMTLTIEDTTRSCQTLYNITFVTEDGKLVANDVTQQKERIYTGLIPGKGYKVTVTAIDFVSKAASSEVTSKVVKTLAISGPVDVRVIASSDNSITIGWAPGPVPQDITEYEVSVYDMNGQAFVNQQKTDKLELVVPGIKACNSYKIVVGSQYLNVPLPRYAPGIDFISQPSKVTEPVLSVQIDNITYTSFGAAVMDSARLCPVSYMYTVMMAGTLEVVASTTSKNPIVAITGLQPGTKYYINVTVLDDQTQVASTVVTSEPFSTMTSPAPTDLTVGNIDGSSALISWIGVPNISELPVEFYHLTVAIGTDVVVQENVNTQSLTLNQLDSCTAYLVTLSVKFNGIAKLQYAEPVNFVTTHPASLPPVNGLKAGEESYTSLTLTIEDKARRTCPFMYQISGNVSDETPFVMKTPAKAVRVTGLQPGTSYQFQVSVLDEETGLQSETVQASVARTMDAPQIQNVHISKVTSDSAEIDFSLPSPMSGLTVTDNKLYLYQKDDLIFETSLPSGQESFNISPLKGCSKYKAKLGLRYQEDKIEVTTDMVDFETVSPDVIAPVDGVTVSSVNTISATITIDDKQRDCQTFYKLVVTDQDGVTVSEQIWTGKTISEVSGLVPKTSYTVTVYANDDATRRISTGVESSKFTTNAAPVPTSVAVADATSNTLTVTWIAPESVPELTVSSYLVNVMQGGEEVEVIQAGSSDLQQVISSLKPCSTYNISVGATYSQLENPAYSDAITGGTKADSNVSPVNNVAANNPTAVSFFFMIDDDERTCPSSYVYTITMDDGAVVRTEETTEKDITALKMTPGTLYTVSVVVKDTETGVQSPAVKSNSIKTITLDPPQYLSVTGETDNSAVITWRAPVNRGDIKLVSYQLEVGTLKSTAALFSKKLDLATTSVTAQQLSACTKYQYRVGAIFEDIDATIWTSYYSFKTSSPSVIDPVESITLSSPTASTITFEIKDGTRPCQVGYLLKIMRGNVLVSSYTTTSTQGTISKLQPSTTYKVTVVAKDNVNPTKLAKSVLSNSISTLAA